MKRFVVSINIDSLLGNNGKLSYWFKRISLDRPELSRKNRKAAARYWRHLCEY